MKKTLLLSSLILTTLFGQTTLSAWFGKAKVDEKYTARFMVRSDIKTQNLAGFQMPDTWWSRPYEYAWAAQFAEKDHVVLDAACGIEHPFKWQLNNQAKETWASDLDERIASHDSVQKFMKEVLEESMYNRIMDQPRPINDVRLVHGSICALPDFMPLFDRIFCISTLEHMTKEDRRQALIEFGKKLKPDGLVVLTVDYPVVTPEELFASAADAGLEPVGNINTEHPNDELSFGPHPVITPQKLSIFRCVLKKK